MGQPTNDGNQWKKPSMEVAADSKTNIVTNALSEVSKENEKIFYAELKIVVHEDKRTITCYTVRCYGYVSKVTRLNLPFIFLSSFRRHTDEDYEKVEKHTSLRKDLVGQVWKNIFLQKQK